MRIERNVDTPFFEKMLSGEKNFEVSVAYWDCKPGDTLVMHEWDPEGKKRTGRVLEKEVTYVLKTKDLKFWPEEKVKKHGYIVVALK
jgi:ribosomal protein S17